MGTTKVMDWAVKIMSMCAIPSLAWAWSLSLEVNDLRDDLGDAEVVIIDLKTGVAETQTNNKDIIGMKKDIEYMKKTLDRIEIAVGR